MYDALYAQGFREAAVEFGFQLSRGNDQHVGVIDNLEAAASRMQNAFVGPEDAVRREEAIADVVDHHLVSIPVDLLQVPVAAR